MDATDRFLAYATGQAAFVGVVAGLAGGLTLFAPLGFSHSYLAVGASGPAARLTHWLVRAFLVVALALYVLVPVGVAGYLVRYGDRHPLSYVAVAAVAVVGLPVTLAIPGAVGQVGFAVAAVLALVVVLAWLSVGVLVRHDVTRAAFLNVAILAVVVVGAVAGSFLAAPAGALVVQHSESAPQVSFSTDYAERGDGRDVLTFTHEGGEVVRAGRLSVEGDGVTDVPGATQTAPGPWRGEATAEWDGERAVGPSDSVTVGVEGECMVRVVYRTEWSSATLAKHTCPGAEA